VSPAAPLLRVENLRVEFPTEDGPVHAVAGVTFEVFPGRTLGIVGESGSGKSATSLTVLGLTRRAGAGVSGRVLFAGRDLLALPENQLRSVRGNEIAMIFQDPLSSLHPLYKIGRQLVEAIRAHRDISKSSARARAVELLGLVGIPDPGRRVDDYPHQFSGGMRQRVMIAMALSCEPSLLIADEPTSALDVTVQAQILDLLRRLRSELGMALVLVTHDLGVVGEMADEIAVMHGGLIVEHGSAEQVLAAPRHPYTISLLRSMPSVPRPPGGSLEQPLEGSLERPPEASIEPPPPAEPLLEVRDLVKRFPVTRGVVFQRRVTAVEAVAGVSFALMPSETLGLVGETGCGKSTTARLLMRLLEPTSGSVRFAGRDITPLKGAPLRAVRREMQIVFQDPFSSLNPRRTAGSIIAEPFAIHGLHPGRSERRRAVAELMETVGLSPEHYSRYPHEFSGGQAQRIGVARALALRPKLLIADEPVSALDVSIQAQILDLLRRLRDEMGLALLLISHDLSVVRSICDRVAVMRAGAIVEIGRVDQIYGSPSHPYTRELLAAVPGGTRTPPVPAQR
jgi:peptide/nickel transport system ATP-binding protein